METVGDQGMCDCRIGAGESQLDDALIGGIGNRTVQINVLLELDWPAARALRPPPADRVLWVVQVALVIAATSALLIGFSSLADFAGGLSPAATRSAVGEGAMTGRPVGPAESVRSRIPSTTAPARRGAGTPSALHWGAPAIERL